MACELLPGQNIEKSWGSLSSVSRELLVTSAAKTLRELHASSYDFFGEISLKGPFGRFEKWSDYLESKMSYFKGTAKELCVFDREVFGKIEHYLDLIQPDLNSVKSPSLVHQDYHLGNILHQGDTITGVVDFEWAVSGDPLLDLLYWFRKSEDCPGSKEIFLSSYGVTTLSESEERRLVLYRVIENIELFLMAIAKLDRRQAEDYRKRLYSSASTL